MSNRDVKMSDIYVSNLFNRNFPAARARAGRGNEIEWQPIWSDQSERCASQRLPLGIPSPAAFAFAAAGRELAKRAQRRRVHASTTVLPATGE